MTNLTRKQLFGWGSAALMIVMLGSLLGFGAYQSLALGIALKNQPLQARMPPQVRARVEKTGRLPLQVDGRVAVEIPVNQIVSTSLTGTFPAQVKVNMQVPLNVNVPYKGVIPIHSNVDIETTTAVVFPHLPVVPLKVQLPVQVDIPIDTVLPLHTVLQVQYAGPLTMQFNQRVSTPIHTVIHSTITMHHQVNSPPIGGFDLNIQPQQTPVAATMQAHIHQPLKQISLSRYAPAVPVASRPASVTSQSAMSDQ